MFLSSACVRRTPIFALRTLAAAGLVFAAQHTLAQSSATDPNTDAGVWMTPDWVPSQVAQQGQDIVPADIEQAKRLWQQANREVAEFPRGHMDLLRWERQQAQPSVNADREPPTELGLAESLQRSMLLRPDLMLIPGMNALKAQEINAEYADHRRKVQSAWVKAIEARQAARLQQAVLDNARTGSELGRRMLRAGNWSQARYMQEQMVEANAWQSLAQARQTEQAALASLATLMGVWQADDLATLAERLPAQLPPVQSPPPKPGELLLPADAMREALSRHPGVAASRFAAERHLLALPPGRWSQWQNHIGDSLAAHDLEKGAPLVRDRRLLNDEALMEAVEMQATAVRMATERRSQIRRAWSDLQWRHAQAVHVETVLIQLQTALEDETLLRYNGMLQSTWELLASARSKLQAVQDGASARAAYWLTKANWDAVLLGADDQPSDMNAIAGGSGEATSGGH